MLEPLDSSAESLQATPEIPIRIPVSRPAMGAEEHAAVGKVLESRWLSIGEVTREFERRLAELMGVKHVVAVNSGSAALHLALSVAVTSPEDEVIVPSLTFVSTVQMIRAAGGRPVFCEVDPTTLNMNPDDVERRVTRNTKAILPVHFGGVPCDMNRLDALAANHGLMVIQDAAHAFASRYQGRMIGSLRDLTCFSFSPLKNITCGEGGAIATDRDDLVERLRLRSNIGISADTWSRQNLARQWDFTVESEGLRYPMSNINAAIGLAQLGRLDQFRERKNAIAQRYDREFSGVPGLAVIEKNFDEIFCYCYPIRVLNGHRDPLLDRLRDRGIGTSVHYRPIHTQPSFAKPGVSLPVTEQLFEELITLPLFAEMRDGEQDEVIQEVVTFLRQSVHSQSLGRAISG